MMLNKNKLSSPKLPVLLTSLAKLGINPGHASAGDWDYWCSWRLCDLVHWFARVLYFLFTVPFLFLSSWYCIIHISSLCRLAATLTGHKHSWRTPWTIPPFRLLPHTVLCCFSEAMEPKYMWHVCQVLDGSASCNVGHAKSYACMQYIYAVTKIMLQSWQSVSVHRLVTYV